MITISIYWLGGAILTLFVVGVVLGFCLLALTGSEPKG